MKYWDTPGRERPFKPSEPTAPRHPVASGGDLRKYPFLRTFYEHQSEIGGGLQKFFFFVVIATLLYVFVLGDAGVLKIMSLQKEKAGLSHPPPRVKRSAPAALLHHSRALPATSNSPQ